MPFLFKKEGERLKVEKILEAQQPDIHKRLKKNIKKSKKSRRGKQENLSFSDYMDLMKHHSYYRGIGGALRQR